MPYVGLPTARRSEAGGEGGPFVHEAFGLNGEMAKTSLRLKLSIWGANLDVDSLASQPLSHRGPSAWVTGGGDMPKIELDGDREARRPVRILRRPSQPS